MWHQERTRDLIVSSVLLTLNEIAQSTERCYMSIQLWDLKGEIIGNFFLVYEEFLSPSTPPPHPAVRKFAIDPEFNDKNVQTGKFNIDITFAIDTEEEKPPPNIIADVGRDIFNMYVDLLAFLSGNAIRMLNPPYIVHNYPGTNKFRRITFPSEQAILEPPVPLVNTSIFTAKLEQKHNMILAWLRRALQEKDVINSILALFIPLEILANQFPCEEKVVVSCGNCGHVMESRPGMRMQVQNLLLNKIGYNSDQFKKIWGKRKEIIHGRLLMSSDQIRELNMVKQDLILAVIKGMKKFLGIGSHEPPREVPPSWAFADPILDIDYIQPEK